MLLTDGCPNTTEDLRVYESAILDVANTEFIDLKTKLELATGEISEEVIDTLLDRPLIPGQPVGDPQGVARRTIGVSDVVVTRQLKRWHALHALAVVYRDAFNNQLNDRYQVKSAEYHELERVAREHTLRFGIGLVYRPIPQAATPSASFTSGGAGGTYYVQVAWVGAGGVEGSPSELTAFDATAGTSAVLGMGAAPAGATGYNVYAALTPGPVALQNSTPLGTGQSFTLSGALVTGRAPTGGQIPDVYVTFPRLSRRG